MTNKQALRDAAEKAGTDEWCAFIDTKSKTYAVHTPGDNRCGDVVKWAGFDGQQRAAAKAKFIASANPATVLALLDELEAKDKSISFLKDQLAQLANFNPDWDKLEAATDSLREHMAELTAARARIAELEAREVKLPQRYSMLHRADFDEPYHTVFVYKQHQVIEVLQAAGIRINGEG